MFAVLLLAPFFSHAATLDVLPASASVTVGQSITVRVFLNADQAVNAMSGTLSFPPTLLSADYVSKSGSVFTLWVQDPVISNSAGNVTWSGVVPNPGFIGRGQAMSITLRAKKTGTANLSLATSEVLANDGNGTNILKSASGGTITIVEGETPLPAPPTVETPKAPVTITPPEIIAYPAHLFSGDTLFIIGTTNYHNSPVTIFFTPAVDQTESMATTSDSSGTFYFVSRSGLNAGLYTISAQVRTKGVMSSSSVPVTVSVASLPEGGGMNWILIIVLLIIIGALVVLLARRRNTRHKTS